MQDALNWMWETIRRSIVNVAIAGGVLVEVACDVYDMHDAEW